jgi:hypothetical protein
MSPKLGVVKVVEATTLHLTNNYYKMMSPGRRTMRNVTIV